MQTTYSSTSTLSPRGGAILNASLQRQVKHTEQNRPDHALGFATKFLQLRSGNDIKLAKGKKIDHIIS